MIAFFRYLVEAFSFSMSWCERIGSPSALPTVCPGPAVHGRAGEPGAVDGGAEEGQQPEGGEDPGDRPPRHWACLCRSAAAAAVVQAGGEQG